MHMYCTVVRGLFSGFQELYQQNEGFGMSGTWSGISRAGSGISTKVVDDGSVSMEGDVLKI